MKLERFTTRKSEHVPKKKSALDREYPWHTATQTQHEYPENKKNKKNNTLDPSSSSAIQELT